MSETADTSTLEVAKKKPEGDPRELLDQFEQLDQPPMSMPPLPYGGSMRTAMEWSKFLADSTGAAKP